MKKLIIACILSLVPALTSAPSLAAEEGVELQSAGIDLSDKASLQRGAKYFVNYCMGCHSLQYMRWNRMAEDLGIDQGNLRKNLILGNAKPGDHMTNAMRPEDGEKWFGKSVPDLTLVTRWRSPDWVYTYLKSFYLDNTRPWGVNNVVFPKVGMPDVLAPLQGEQKAVFEPVKEEGAEPQVDHLELVKAGSLSPEQFDARVRDLTNFLTYAGEPIRLERQHLGLYVLLFLALFFVLTYALKKEYWKDVH
jgi:ubiquinol-cytochrome c reductase cytochrome c1 subunit